MIEVRDLCESNDGKVVVDHLSFSVQPGVVTGFHGPNGAGKSTTMRLIVANYLLRRRAMHEPTSGLSR